MGITTQIHTVEEAQAQGLKRFVPCNEEDAISGLVNLFKALEEGVRELSARLGYARLQPMRSFHLLYVIFFILLGGHSAMAFPGPLECTEVNAIAVGDGERVAPNVVDALAQGRKMEKILRGS